MNAEELPPGWAWSTLDEVGVVSGGLTQSKARAKSALQVPFLRVANVQAGRLDLSDLRLIGVQPTEISRTSLAPNDLLFVEGNGSIDQIGRCALWPGEVEGCVHQNHIIKVRLNGVVVPEYALFWFLSARGRAFIEQVASSTSGLHTLSISKIADLGIPIAPLGEQARIVAAIGTLFAELDEAEAALARAREGVEQFRASLLHAAFTGQLTAAWRAANPPHETGADLLRRILAERRAAWERTERARLEARGTPPRGDGWKARYDEPEEAESTSLPELPTGWTWTALAQLGHFGRGKSRHRPRNDDRLYGNAVPFIQTGDVSRSGGRIRNYSQSYSAFGVAQSKIWPKGTVCITIAANIAASGILEFDSCFPDSVVGLICFDDVVAQYVEAFIRTARNNLEAYAPATAQKNINLDILNTLAVPLPPLAEIREIAGLIKDLNNAILATDLPSEADLRQSILHAAFTGRLVRQDPSDEPATALLSRLRTTAPTRRPARRARSEAQA